MQPALSYYRSVAGEWEGPLDFCVTDPGHLRDKTGWFQALSWRLMASLPGLRLRTSVAVVSDIEARHTTQVRWGPLALMTSVESLALAGTAVTVSGAVRTIDGKRDEMVGSATVAEDARSAAYEVRFLGVDIVQKSALTREGVVLRQEGPGFASQASLRSR